MLLRRFLHIHTPNTKDRGSSPLERACSSATINSRGSLYSLSSIAGYGHIYGTAPPHPKVACWATGNGRGCGLEEEMYAIMMGHLALVLDYRGEFSVVIWVSHTLCPSLSENLRDSLQGVGRQCSASYWAVLYGLDRVLGVLLKWIWRPGSSFYLMRI
jgi:hypothetical protein